MGRSNLRGGNTQQRSQSFTLMARCAPESGPLRSHYILILILILENWHIRASEAIVLRLWWLVVVARWLVR